MVDLPAKERHSRAVLLRVVNELERIVGRPRAAAENPHHQFGIVLRQFLHRARAMINDLQKERTA